MKGKENLNSHHAACMVGAVNCCSTGLVNAAAQGFRQDRMRLALKRQWRAARFAIKRHMKAGTQKTYNCM